MSFSKLKIYGDCDIDYVWCKNGKITDEEIKKLKSGVYKPIWDSKTITLATFDEDVSASCFENNSEILKYEIQRRNTRDNILLPVCTVDADTKFIQDYNVSSNSTYEYWLTPVFNTDGLDTYNSPIITDKVTPKWHSLSIVGLKETKDKNIYEVDTENVWNFCLNIKEFSIAPQFDKVYSDGYGQFSKVSSGKRNYLKGSHSCLIGDVVNCGETYGNDDIYKLEKWREFCYSKNLKLLKDSKGYVIPVDIEDTSMSINNSLLEQPTTISFNYRQMADHNAISVYGLEEVI